MPAADRPKTRILFLAWGYSVHAERRIRPFVEDGRFEVAVASTHDYAFQGARNVLLDGRDPGKGDRSRANFADRVRGRIRHEWAGALTRFLSRRDPETTRADVDRWLNDRDALLRLAREFRPGAVFLQTLLYPCWLALFLPQDVPLMITFWNGDLLWWAKRNGLERLLKKRIVRQGVRRAKAVTVNSRAAAEACALLGAKDGRVHLLPYPGVDTERFFPRSRDDDRRSLGISAGKVVLCPRGTADYLNGDVVADAVEAVARRFPDVLFLFLFPSGDATPFEPLRERLAGAGLARHVRVGGAVPWESMPVYYGAADAVVSVSSNDSLPNCMLEAMACGIPVVMGDIPAIREWVEDGRNGLLVPPRDARALADALIRLLDDDGGTAAAFGRINLARVRADADSRRNLERAKALALSVAGER